MSDRVRLPAGVTVFERGWLSANNIVFKGAEGTALVDSGYVSHAPQTVALVRGALEGRPLDLLLNTHLHSDHCGGNAALQEAYAGVRTFIPPGQAEQVRNWDPVALTYVPTGQECPRFGIQGLLEPGHEVRLAGATWEIQASPGHDPHSVILFEPVSRTLLSADALWENGFGVVFPELEGRAAFDEVAGTLDVIEQLRPGLVIPGHGRVFGGAEEIRAALARARGRLAAFVQDPVRHASHAAKVLVKFRLLDWQQVPLADLIAWAVATPYFSIVAARYFADRDVADWVAGLVDELVRAQVAARSGDLVVNL
jgi:glyoxylase-like metal-dependent hydrolase (beta-lactamase superfamily II)